MGLVNIHGGLHLVRTTSLNHECGPRLKPAARNVNWELARRMAAGADVDVAQARRGEGHCGSAIAQVAR